MSTIVLLSCTKSKLDKKSPAKDLYSKSPTFQKTLKYGETLKPDKMYILSAKYHLVPLDMTLSPYDLTLKDMSSDEKEKWGNKVLQQMSSKGIDIKKDNFIFLTGKEYMKPLIKHIPDENIETPLEGKRMGERMKWLNSQIETIKEIFIKIKEVLYERLYK